MPENELNKQKVAYALLDPDTYATVLLAICLKKYGTEIFDVDQLTVIQWLKEDFKLKEIAEENENKLKAAMALVTTDYFYNTKNVFEAICFTLSGGKPDEEDELTIPELMWGIYEAALLSDDNSVEMNDFSQNIKDYINNILESDIVDDFKIPDEVLYSLYIKDNVKELKEQLEDVGLLNDKNKDLKFPTLNLDV